MTTKQLKIGVAITTHNRYEVFKETYEKTKKLLPKGAKLVVVDDASETPCPEATFRFDVNVGIATAKNKCFELLDDCDHFFLFDDDCYPIDKDWWKPYVESEEAHFCYIFKDFVHNSINDCQELYRDDKIIAYSHARGCMLYFKKVCLETIGGMDINYARWGFEHMDISNRIFNSGLTTFRYMDVVGSNKLIYSLDEQESVVTTVMPDERRKYLIDGQKHYEKSLESKEYLDYRIPVRDTTKENNKIVTVFLNSVEDPERKVKWEADSSLLEPLIKSVKENNNELVVLTDCFDKLDGAEVVKEGGNISPYMQRWVSYYRYLRKHPEIDNIWLVDATDVEMLKDCFRYMDRDKLYVGSEKQVLGCNWIYQNHNNPILYQFVRINRNRVLLNAGLVGGSRDNVLAFLQRMLEAYSRCRGDIGAGDMALFNYVCYGYFNERIEFGEKINTVFKDYEKDNKTAWWKHK